MWGLMFFPRDVSNLPFHCLSCWAASVLIALPLSLYFHSCLTFLPLPFSASTYTKAHFGNYCTFKSNLRTCHLSANCDYVYNCKYDLQSRITSHLEVFVPGGTFLWILRHTFTGHEMFLCFYLTLSVFEDVLDFLELQLPSFIHSTFI